MSQFARRFLEPRGRIDRVLYALQTLFLPYTAFVAIKGGLEFAGIFCIVFWVPMAFYTLEWIFWGRRV